MLEKRNEAHSFYEQVLKRAHEDGLINQTLAYLGRHDLFFLLYYLMGRVDIDHDWLYDRCRDVQYYPNNYLDLWAREHYKSTIITVGKTIQDVLNDPEITFGIFSLTRPIAKGFLFSIRSEFTDNKTLKDIYPDVLYQTPERESPRWSLDEGIIVKRKSKAKEATVEGWGLIDAMPTSRHYQVRMYDDIIDERHVGNPEIIKKSIRMWEISLSLGSAIPSKCYPKSADIARYAGTRYHANDTYRELIKRDAAKLRLYPGTDNCQVDGSPVLWSQELMDKKRREMGSYTFGCLGESTMILMSDWSVKPIYEVKAGDVVVGWEMEPNKRTRLVRSIVKATQQHRADTVEISIGNNVSIICTPDHKWWSGKRKEDRNRKIYRPAGVEYNRLSSLCRVIDVSENRLPDSPEAQQAAAYLAGIFDGEGTVSGGSVHISQSEKHHPEVCERIRRSFEILGFDYGEHKRNGDSRDGQIDFYLRGGRQAIFRFLMLCDPAKRKQITDSMFNTRYLGIRDRDKIKSIGKSDRQMVYNIETETGNYIANGYCSANCQILQDPTADQAQGFNTEDLRYWNPQEPAWLRMNRYLLCDPAGEKKKDNDYTVMLVIGLNDDNSYYLVDGIRDRLNLTERAKHYIRFHRLYQPNESGYEKYGKDSDIEHIEYVMQQENYRFEIIPLGGQVKKNDRIRKLIPIVESNRLYVPVRLLFMDYEKKQHDLTQELIDDEMTMFPVASHDDILDCAARITDADLGAKFPKPDQRDRVERIRQEMNHIRPEHYDPLRRVAV